jgi:3-dehydroquinate synthase
VPRITHRLPTPPPVTIDAVIEPALLARAAEFLPAQGGLFIITTAPVWRHWGATLERALEGRSPRRQVLELPDGEPHKRLASVESLADELLARGADRDSTIVAFGGGVVGDLAGFLASIYMRGVALEQIPTTLVAMLDSSLGGKTGVNLAGGKNLLGTFYHPRQILVDPLLLNTLPEREYRSGLAEAIKYAIIGDAELFEYMAAHIAPLHRREPAAMEHVIARGLAQKAAVVARDEREGDLRRILNFGHTLGHALESATEYRHFLHGEAVAWGMIAATAIASRLQRITAADAERVRQTILALCAPLPKVEIPPERVLACAASDKKSQAGRLHFVLPRAIGEVEITSEVPRETILAALAEL